MEIKRVYLLGPTNVTKEFSPDDNPYSITYYEWNIVESPDGEYLMVEPRETLTLLKNRIDVETDVDPTKYFKPLGGVYTLECEEALEAAIHQLNQ
jgi:hypothetical protein